MLINTRIEFILPKEIEALVPQERKKWMLYNNNNFLKRINLYHMGVTHLPQMSTTNGLHHLSPQTLGNTVKRELLSFLREHLWWTWSAAKDETVLGLKTAWKFPKIILRTTQSHWNRGMMWERWWNSSFFFFFKDNTWGEAFNNSGQSNLDKSSYCSKNLDKNREKIH